MSKAWREPMMWLVVALPAASVLASVAVIVALSRAGPADSVAEQVQRVSQIQTTDLSPDQQAQRLGLSALLGFNGDSVELRPVSGTFAAGEALELVLAHPTDETQDRHLTLHPGDGSWRTEAVVPVSSDWNLYLTPADGRWRITGRLLHNERAALLNAGLTPP